MSQLIRWALILPGAFVAWYIALFLGVGVHAGIEALCPADQMVSGECSAPWFLAAEKAAVALGAALAAVLVMITCTLLAPSHRRQVAITTFVVGAIVATYMGLYLFTSATVAAIAAGAVALFILLRRMAPFSPPNNSLERTRER